MMDKLEGIFSAIQTDANIDKVSGDFIPASSGSGNAGSNYLYINCYAQSDKVFDITDYRRVLLVTASNIRGKELSQNFVSVVFSIYRLSEDKPNRLYRAVFIRSKISKLTSFRAVNDCLENEETY